MSFSVTIFALLGCQPRHFFGIFVWSFQIIQWVMGYSNSFCLGCSISYSIILCIRVTLQFILTAYCNVFQAMILFQRFSMPLNSTFIHLRKHSYAGVLPFFWSLFNIIAVKSVCILKKSEWNSHPDTMSTVTRLPSGCILWRHAANWLRWLSDSHWQS